MHCRGLRAVFESMQSRQASFAAQRVNRIAVGIGNAHNGLVIPLRDLV
jgi:hypothetical protein